MYNKQKKAGSSVIIEIDKDKEITLPFTINGQLYFDKTDDCDLMLEVPEDTFYFGETVLVQNCAGWWIPAQYGFYDNEDGFHVMFGGQRFKECVPLKGHAHLIKGTVTFKDQLNDETDKSLS